VTTTEAVLEAIRSVPKGKVAGYAQIAALAGVPNGARMVARLLHSCSGKHRLPWWRIVRSNGTIALPENGGASEQAALLKKEGVGFRSALKVDPAFFWTP
jgi:methylated-DNA-protein-cysteine methyltransferase-like protein